MQVSPLDKGERDQGSQFTNEAFTAVLREHDSMDGKGPWADNVFFKRLWRSLKYEEVYLKAYDGIAEARALIGRYLTFFTAKPRHRSLGRRTPNAVDYESADRRMAA